MTRTSAPRSLEADGTSAYQSMVPSPFDSSLPGDGLHGESGATNTLIEIKNDRDVISGDAVAHGPSRRHSIAGWVQEYRILEFCSAAVLYLVALIFSTIEVHERPIPGIRVRLNPTAVVWSLDPSIDETNLLEQVPTWLLILLGIGLPMGTNIFVNYVLPVLCEVRVIFHDTRDLLLTLFQATALATSLTQFTKNITGRFRPSFYDMCKWNYDVVWDGVTNLCTDPAGEQEGRKSFPSGHASFAWSSMLVLTLYLLGRSRLNCENRSKSMLRGGKKSLMLVVCCAPVLLASYIAISRCIDNWHHYSDILAGSIIGAVSALFAFSYNYGSIFSWDFAGLPLEEIHELRMKGQQTKSEINQPLM